MLFDNGLNNWWPRRDLNTHCAMIANFDHQRRHCSRWRTHRQHVWAVTDCAHPPHDCKTTHNEHCKSFFKGINWWQCMPDCTRSAHWYAERVGNVSLCRWPVETAVGGCWGKRFANGQADHVTHSQWGHNQLRWVHHKRGRYAIWSMQICREPFTSDIEYLDYGCVERLRASRTKGVLPSYDAWRLWVVVCPIGRCFFLLWVLLHKPTSLLLSPRCWQKRRLTWCVTWHCWDTARKLFVQRFDLTIHQRLTRAFAIGGVDVNEKPSQWMARFRHASGDWTRDDVERWALLRRLPSSLRTTLEIPSPPLHMAELLRKADELYVTLPTTTVSSIGEAPTELATAVYACDVPAVNALFRNRGSGKGSTEYKKPFSEDQLCWYHLKFRDQARYCTGLPCPQHRPDLKKGRKSQAGNATGGQ